MAIKSLPVALTTGLLSLVISSQATAQEGVVWSSFMGGTLGGSTVTTSGFAPNTSVMTSNLSTSNYGFAPLSAAEPTLNYAANDMWTVDFAPTLTGGVLWYGSFIRGAGAFSGTPSTEYTFNHTPTIVSGFGTSSVSGNTLSVPENGFGWGILSFDGPIDTLSCTTTATGISFQSCTFGLPAGAGGPIGTPDPACSTVPNSTGASGALTAFGELDVLQNSCVLTADSLPANQFGLLVASQTPDFVPASMIATTNGNLCLGGMIARFLGQITPSGSAGSISIAADLTNVPIPTGFVSVSPGETWYFQLWHRDIGGAGSNFTDSVGITFQ